MTIYAVMKIGDKKYRVAPGDVVRVENFAAVPGTTVEIREVCLIATGQDTIVGSPTVAGARVVAEVIEEGHDEKIVMFKKKRGNRYHMIIGDQRSHPKLRIREILKPERKAPEPVAKKPLQPPTPPEPPAPAPIATEIPPARVTPPRHVETAAPAPTLEHRGPRKRSSYGIGAVVVALLVVAAGLLVLGSRQPRGPVEAATVAATSQAARLPVPQPQAKARPRKEAAIKKPAAASAPSAPVQPPE